MYIPMGTNCASRVAELFLICYEILLVFVY